MNTFRNALLNRLKLPTTITPNRSTQSSTEVNNGVLHSETIASNPPPTLNRLYKTVELELRGNDPSVLNSYTKFASTTCGHLDINCKTWNSRKPDFDRLTVLKAIHVNKKHRVQYEYRTYYSFVQMTYLTQSTAETVLEYLQRNLPEGVALKTTSVEITKFPEHLTDN